MAPAHLSDSDVQPVLTARGLGRQFGRRWALRDVRLELARGEVLGLVGPNGSGKSTLLRILAGFLQASEGEARVLGYDPYRERRRVMENARFAFAPPALFEALTAREHLVGLVRLSSGDRRPSATRIDEVLGRVGLAERADEPVRVFSFGMRQRLALAQALLPTPELLVLDEPSDGLDPVAVAELRELLRGLARDTGAAILVAGHLMSEMAALADRILVLVDGRELFQGPPQELSAGSERLVLRVDQPERAREVLAGEGLLASVADASDGARAGGGELALAPGAIGLADSQSLLARHGLRLEEYRLERDSLEAALIQRLHAAARRGSEGAADAAP